MIRCVITANNQTGHILKHRGDYTSTAEALGDSLKRWLASGELRNNERMLSVLVHVESPKEVEG